jgi:hypothetical protein
MKRFRLWLARLVCPKGWHVQRNGGRRVRFVVKETVKEDLTVRPSLVDCRYLGQVQ